MTIPGIKKYHANLSSRPTAAFALRPVSMIDAFQSYVPFLLCGMLVIGGMLNAVAPGPIRAQYASWGYPPGFHYVTAVCELTSAGLLFFSGTRLIGAVLGAAVMGAATITLVRHREYKHMLTPFVASAILIAVASSSYSAFHL